MKRIFMFSPYLHNFGGGEKYFATLAETLSNENFVSIISTNKSVSKKQIEEYFKLNLSKVDFVTFRNISEVSSVTEECDIFICLSNFRYIKSHSNKKIQLLQIPYGKIQTSTIIRKMFSDNFKEGIKDYYRINLLNKCKNDDLVITNSNFVHDILKSNYNLDSFVLHPPIDDFYVDNIKKENIIISVGRIFTGLYNDKRYDIMIDAFRKLYDKEKPDWEYHIIGSLSSDNKSQDYFNDLKTKATGLPIYFHPNEPYINLKEWYNKATLFWHAAGYGINEDKQPDKVEHFGITTVEAMSAYNIPIVINRGGQKEIIANNCNGYLWNTIDDLINRTIAAIKNEVDIEKIQNNSRQRYNSYSKDTFTKNLLKILSEVLD